MKPAEKIERLVKHISFKASPEMDERLRAGIVRAGNLCQPMGLVPDRENIRRRIMRISMAKIAAAALIGTGVVAAAAIGVKYKYHFLKEDERGRQFVVSEDGRRGWVFSEKTASTPDKAIEKAQELDRVLQQGQKEWVGVREIEVNGQLDSRWLAYRYTRDGQTTTQGEYDPNAGPRTLVGERLDEARSLWYKVLEGSAGVSTSDGHQRFITAEGEEIPAYERVVQGRTFSFDKIQFVLSDGTEVAWSMGVPKND